MSSPTVMTFGCRLNTSESEVIGGHAGTAGLGNSVIVNSCAVTAEAVRQGRQAIRRLRRERPDARIVVTGCAAQIDPDRFARMAEVDHVVGNAEKMQAGTYRALASGDARRVIVAPWPPVPPPAAGAPRDTGRSASRGGLPRAWVEIQNGCDHRCTFCVIPLGRGPSRSLPAHDVVARIRQVVDGGCTEVVLTGVDITSYGGDIPGDMSLGRLVRLILRDVPDLARLRVSSFDLIEADADLLDAFAHEARLMPHLHLSLQAGNDLILKRMKRRHGRAQAIAFAKEMRRRRPDVLLGADLIAGFPTETEAQFADTMSLVDECGLTLLHVFVFSPREGTPAARMPQVPPSIARDRAGRLRHKGALALRGWLDGRVGGELDAVLERPSQDRTGHARSPQFEEVVVTGLAAPRAAGHVVRAHIVGHDGRRLRAEAIAAEAAA